MLNDLINIIKSANQIAAIINQKKSILINCEKLRVRLALFDVAVHMTQMLRACSDYNLDDNEFLISIIKRIDFVDDNMRIIGETESKQFRQMALLFMLDALSDIENDAHTLIDKMIYEDETA